MIIQLLLLSILIQLSNCLNLNFFGVSDWYYASSIAVYRNRAFLALPRSLCSNNFSQPTLIESQWNGDRQTMQIGRKQYFPDETSQTWGNCNSVQDVISLDLEHRKARLWVLDKGTKDCPPKLVIYNVFNNLPASSWTIHNGHELEMIYMVVDASGPFGARAYIAESMLNKIVVFCASSGRWWMVNVKQADGAALPFSINRLALSPIESKLYTTSDQSNKIACVDFTLVQNAKFVTGVQNVSTIFVGEKLGPSGGMTVDFGNGLTYYYSRDYAIVRWPTRTPLNAENHEILIQSYEKIPYVSHLFVVGQNEVWALINPTSPYDCEAFTNNGDVHPHEHPAVKKRVMRLSKFVKLGRRTNTIFTVKT